MDFSEKRIFLTGSDGFLGPHLQNHLIQEGAEIFGLSRKKKPDTQLYQHPKSKILTGDILNREQIKEALKISEPDIIIHLAAQSHVGASFSDPARTCEVNCTGTAILLDMIRESATDPLVIFPGSADEYGLVISSEDQYERILQKKRNVIPKPIKIPELPVSEGNPLRPLSPYGVSKVYGDYLTRSYHHSYGMKTMVVRSFNIEGHGRGEHFVTASLSRQVAEYQKGFVSSIQVGDVSVFRDFSHISDAIAGYCCVMNRGVYGDIYNLGSMRATSVLTYLLNAIESAGYIIRDLSSFDGSFHLNNPLSLKKTELFGFFGEYSHIDTFIANNASLFSLQSGGISISTDKGVIPVSFDPNLFRPSDNPFIVADIQKIREIGYHPQKTIRDIATEQVCSYF